MDGRLPDVGLALVVPSDSITVVSWLWLSDPMTVVGLPETPRLRGMQLGPSMSQSDKPVVLPYSTMLL